MLPRDVGTVVVPIQFNALPVTSQADEVNRSERRQ